MEVVSPGIIVRIDMPLQNYRRSRCGDGNCETAHLVYWSSWILYCGNVGLHLVSQVAQSGSF